MLQVKLFSETQTFRRRRDVATFTLATLREYYAQNITTHNALLPFSGSIDKHPKIAKHQEVLETQTRTLTSLIKWRGSSSTD